MPTDTRPRILRLPAVKDRTGCSTSTIDRKERAGEFPRRIKIGANSVGWLEEEIDRHIEELIAARDAEAA